MAAPIVWVVRCRDCCCTCQPQSAWCIPIQPHARGCQGRGRDSQLCIAHVSTHLRWQPPPDLDRSQKLTGAVTAGAALLLGLSSRTWAGGTASVGQPARKACACALRRPLGVPPGNCRWDGGSNRRVWAKAMGKHAEGVSSTVCARKGKHIYFCTKSAKL